MRQDYEVKNEAEIWVRNIKMKTYGSWEKLALDVSIRCSFDHKTL